MNLKSSWHQEQKLQAANWSSVVDLARASVASIFDAFASS